MARSSRLVPALALLLAVACAPAAPPSPTSAPARPPATEAPAKPAPTTAPAAPAKAESKPAPTAAPARPTEKPAAKPTEKPAAPAEADVQRAADFYRGATVRIIVGFSAGGLADTYSRAIVPLLSESIPGRPTVIVENRPGAGSLVAANAVYNTEAKDGTVIGAVETGVVQQQAVGGPGVQFDAARMQVIGSAGKGTAACLVRTDTGIKTIQEAIGKELNIGTTGTANSTYLAPAALNIVLGTKFKLLSGYGSLANARLALESKEVDGICPSSDALTSLDRQRLEGASPLARVIVSIDRNLPDAPYLKDVPVAVEIVTNEEDRRLLRTVDSSLQFFPLYFMAPEVPPERVAAIRQGFERALTNQAFLKASAERGLSITLSRHADVERQLRDMLTLPESVKGKLRQLLNPQG